MINTATRLVQILEIAGFEEKDFNLKPFMAKYENVNGRSVTLFEKEYKVKGVPTPIPYPDSEKILSIQLANFGIV